LSKINAKILAYIDGTECLITKNKKQVYLNGNFIDKKNVTEIFIQPVAKQLGLSEEVFAIFCDDSNKKQFIDEIFDYIKEKPEREAQKKEADNQAQILAHEGIDFSQITPLLHYTSDELILFDRKTKTFSQLHPMQYRRAYGVTDLRSQKTQDFYSELPPCLTEMNPFRLESIYKKDFDGREIFTINEYVHPPWMKDKLTEAEIEALTIPKDIDRFLDHLCDNKESKIAVLDWMARAVWSKANTHLCLNGDKEIGKSFFCSLFKCLVGDKYVQEAPKSLGKRDFNSIMKNSRILIYEEMSVTKFGSDDSTHEFLKRVANEDIAIEGKGTNPETIKNVTSIIICNNNLGSLQIDSNDRRFLVPELTTISPQDVGLDDLLDGLRLDYIDEEKRCLEKVRQFAFYLKHHCIVEKYSRRVYKGPRFRLAVKANLEPWQGFIVEKVLSRIRVEYDVRKLRKEFKEDSLYEDNKFPSRLDKFQALFDNFLDEETGKKVATVTKQGNEITIIPVEKYLPRESERLNTEI